MNFEHIYENVAIHYGVTVEEVKSEILKAMEMSKIKGKDVDEFITNLLIYEEENLGLL